MYIYYDAWMPNLGFNYFFYENDYCRYIGDLLLPVHDTEAHLALICQILGPFPRDMIPSVNHETSKYDFEF